VSQVWTRLYVIYTLHEKAISTHRDYDVRRAAAVQMAVAAAEEQQRTPANSCAMRRRDGKGADENTTAPKSLTVTSG